MTSDISVVICAYTGKRWDALSAAVASVQCQTLPPREIIVVIDHNPDLLVRAQHHFAGVTVIENWEDRGLSGARNSGWVMARGNIIAFLDDDAIAAREWLASLQETFVNPDVFGVGGPVLPLWLEKEPAWFPKEFYWVVGCTYQGMYGAERVCKIRNPIGANMAFRRRIFTDIGGFRREVGRVGALPLGCEETELCIRARQRLPGQAILHQPMARVSHRVPATRTNWRYFFARCYSEGLSKAFVARSVGTQDGLAAERAYSLSILPLGIKRGLRDGFVRRDLTGFVRAWAIAAGLIVTIAGYGVGQMTLHLTKPGATRLAPLFPGTALLSGAQAVF